MFDGSELEGELQALGADVLEFPALLSIARNHLAALEADLGRGVCHAEAVMNLELPLDSLVRMVIEDWIKGIFRKFDRIAGKLLPADLAAGLTPKRIAASGYANPAGRQDQPEQYHMMPGDPDSYLEQCIAALPPEKREAARHAFEEISETGDDTYLSKLLAVLEANGAYAKMIPKGMTDAGAKVVREYGGHRLSPSRSGSPPGGIVQEHHHRRNGTPGGVSSGAANRAGIERQNELLEQLRRAAAKLDEGVSSGWRSFWWFSPLHAA
jgi:hypothetical protein